MQFKKNHEHTLTQLTNGEMLLYMLKHPLRDFTVLT